MRGIILAGNDADAPAAPRMHQPISLLMLAGIRHILVIAPPADLPDFQKQLGGGEQWGIHLSYAARSADGGALAMASEFVGDHPASVVVENFLRDDLEIMTQKVTNIMIQKAVTLKKGAWILAHSTTDPVPGFGIYDNSLTKRARQLAQSCSVQSELADLNDTYRTDGILEVEVLDEKITHPHIKTDKSLHPPCPEAIASRMGFIGDADQ